MEDLNCGIVITVAGYATSWHCNQQRHRYYGPAAVWCCGNDQISMTWWIHDLYIKYEKGHIE
jgi:hypothetical protein